MENTSKVIKRKAKLFVIAAIGFAALSMTACPQPDEIGNGNKTPTIADFIVSGLSQIYDGNPKAVIITAKSDKSPGLITVYYNGSTDAPSAIDSYNITFNVAAATGWNAARGLRAGTMYIAHQIDNPQTPTAADFDLGFMQMAGKITAVTITPKQGKSIGIITVYYNGSTTFPTAVGIYAVTFDVAAAVGWNAVSGLSAGTLNIGSSVNQTPTLADYDINGTGTFTYDGNVKTVTVTAKSGKSAGTITVKYNGSTTAPSAVGAYRVTFDVAAATGWNAANNLSAGMLTVTAGTPTFTSIDAFEAWLSNLSANTATTAYNIALNVDYLESYNESVKHVLNANSTKYINLDLSGSTITTIPNYAFNTESPSYTGCPTLIGITIPDSVTSIGQKAFENCNNLTDITIGNSVTSIGDYAFAFCGSLNSVTIPNSVTGIGEGVFSGCTSLNSVTIGNGVTSIGVLAFSDCTSLTRVTIPNSVISIEEMAFWGCGSLTSVTIPDSVTGIGVWAFRDCTSFRYIIIPNSVINIGQGAFDGTLWLNDQLDGVVYAGKVAYTYKGAMPENTSIILLNDTKGIADNAFYHCTGLTGVTIPNSVTAIGQAAFGGCTNLTGVTIPNNVTAIGEAAFVGCTSLTNLIISNSVTSIGNQTFFGCSGLTDVTIPNSVTSIGQDAFAFCFGLESVTIGNGVTSIGNYAFGNCPSLAVVIFQSVITSGIFDYDNIFPGDLREKYLAEGIGTYTTGNPGLNAVWTKQ